MCVCAYVFAKLSHILINNHQVEKILCDFYSSLTDSIFQISVVIGELDELSILAYFSVGLVMNFLPSQGGCISSAGGLLLGDIL